MPDGWQPCRGRPSREHKGLAGRLLPKQEMLHPPNRTAKPLIATSATRNTAFSTDAVLRQGDQPSALVLDGADAFGFAAGFRAFAAGFCAFAAGFCVLGGLVLITEGALPGETAAHSSATCSPFSCGSVAGAASRHSRNGSLISNRPRSPAGQPSEECAAKIR